MAEASGRKWWALVAIAASVLVVGLDLTVLNLALPTIATDLHASTGDLQWFSDAYSLVLAAAILPAGLLGDRYGRKKVLLIALALFGASSAACAYAASTSELIAARALLGIGAAAIFPLALSVIPVLFTPEERQRAIALMASATFISFPIGPVVGGYLLDHFWWGSVFLINVPVVVLALVAVVFLLPESRSQRRPAIDIGGVILSSAALTGLTYGFIQAGQNGWGDATAVATIVAGVVLLAGFVAWERRQQGSGTDSSGTDSRGTDSRGTDSRGTDSRGGGGRALIQLGLFRSAGFTWGSLLATFVSFAMFGLFFAMPQYFQEVQGVNASGSGLRLLPMIGGMLVGMIGGTRLATPRRAATANGGPKADGGPEAADGTKDPSVTADGPAPFASAKALVTVGFAIMAIAMAVGATTRTSSGTGFAAAWFATAGLGLGLAMPQAMNAALGVLSAERSGSGSAVITAMRQVGATIGVAILGTVLSSGYRGQLDVTGLPATLAATAKSSVAAGVGVAHSIRSTALLDSVRAAFVHGMDVMLWACGGIALTSAILALMFLPRRASRPVGPADRAAASTTDTPETADTAGEAAATGAERAELEL